MESIVSKNIAKYFSRPFIQNLYSFWEDRTISVFNKFLEKTSGNYCVPASPSNKIVLNSHLHNEFQAQKIAIFFASNKRFHSKGKFIVIVSQVDGNLLGLFFPEKLFSCLFGEYIKNAQIFRRLFYLKDKIIILMEN